MKTFCTCLALSLAIMATACAARVDDDPADEAPTEEAKQESIFPGPGIWWSGPGYSIPYFVNPAGAAFSPWEGDPPWL